MKTANKVIDDRIVILDSFLEKTKDNTEPGVQMNRGNALQAKGLFNQLKLALEDSDASLEKIEKIKELAGQTMIPLVERNKESVDLYKQKMFSLHQRSEEIKKQDLNLADNGPLKTELNDILSTVLEYNKAKKDKIEYLEEYEAALEEIKEFIIEKEELIIEKETVEMIEEETGEEETETETAEATDVTDTDTEESEVPPNPQQQKNENGEFPV